MDELGIQCKFEVLSDGADGSDRLKSELYHYVTERGEIALGIARVGAVTMGVEEAEDLIEMLHDAIKAAESWVFSPCQVLAFPSGERRGGG